NSIFGLTAPLQGFRYRLSAGQYFGDINMRAYNIDLRRYLRFKPVTLAARAYSYIRSGGDENRLRGNYIGYPFCVQGYDNLSRDRVGNIAFDDLMGYRVLVCNFEVRLPCTGPEQLAVVKSGLLLSDLHLCRDAGLAWNSGNKIVSNLDKKPVVQQFNPDG